MRHTAGIKPLCKRSTWKKVLYGGCAQYKPNRNTNLMRHTAVIKPLCKRSTWKKALYDGCTQYKPNLNTNLMRHTAVIKPLCKRSTWTKALYDGGAQYKPNRNTNLMRHTAGIKPLCKRSTWKKALYDLCTQCKPNRNTNLMRHTAVIKPLCTSVKIILKCLSRFPVHLLSQWQRNYEELVKLKPFEIVLARQSMQQLIREGPWCCISIIACCVTINVDLRQFMNIHVVFLWNITFAQFLDWNWMTSLLLSKLGQHWFRSWIVACSAQIYYLNHYWLILIRPLVRKINWDLKHSQQKWNGKISSFRLTYFSIFNDGALLSCTPQDLKPSILFGELPLWFLGRDPLCGAFYSHLQQSRHHWGHVARSTAVGPYWLVHPAVWNTPKVSEIIRLHYTSMW